MKRRSCWWKKGKMKGGPELNENEGWREVEEVLLSLSAVGYVPAAERKASTKTCNDADSVHAQARHWSWAGNLKAQMQAGRLPTSARLAPPGMGPLWVSASLATRVQGLAADKPLASCRRCI